MPDNKLQIYTGEGKGKTTAALGLAIRAAGALQGLGMSMCLPRSSSFRDSMSLKSGCLKRSEMKQKFAFLSATIFTFQMLMPCGV